MNYDMKKTMTFHHEERLLTQLVQMVRKPIVILAGYYSKVLDTEINLRQTLLLLNAQLAFFFTVFPICSLFLRALCLLWLCNALMKCKQAGIRA
ncbi:MAG: ATP-binding protein [Prevotella sp.]|nr:ATP-binding protein [Prevotella sp.]